MNEQDYKKLQEVQSKINDSEIPFALLDLLAFLGPQPLNAWQLELCLFIFLYLNLLFGSLFDLLLLFFIDFAARSLLDTYLLPSRPCHRASHLNLD